MLFGYESGAQAVLTCTLRAKSPTTASIVGTEARIEVEGDFYAPGGGQARPSRRRTDPGEVGRTRAAASVTRRTRSPAAWPPASKKAR